MDYYNYKASRLRYFIETRGYKPLHIASREGNIEFVRLLLESRADPKCRNKDGSTPLHMAAHMGYKEVVGNVLNSVSNPFPRLNAISAYL